MNLQALGGTGGDGRQHQQQEESSQSADLKCHFLYRLGISLTPEWGVIGNRQEMNLCEELFDGACLIQLQAGHFEI